MSTTIPRTLTYADLDRLSGEALPGRFVLSTAGHGPDGDVAYACQYTHSAGTAGLLGTGLLAQPERTTLTCVPVAVHHGS